jgi:predicted methyltransferase
MLRTTGWFLVAVFSLSLASLDAAASTVQVQAAIATAIADPRRPPDQARLDATRKPGQLVAFAGLKPGDRIADFMPGNGYFTRIFSDVVGPTGRVYAFIPSEQLAHCAPSEVAGTRAMASDPSYENVDILTGPAAAFHMVEKLDLIWTAQNYHDLHDAFMGPTDVAKLNRAFFDALKPGGVFLVIDHVAAAGSGLRDTETLHRIDPIRMRHEIEAAGFVLEAHSDVLRNGNDDHRRSVFDPLIRGATDQVVLRFRRPLS